LVATVEHTSDSGGGGIPGDTGFKTTGTVEVNTGWGNMTTTRINTSNNSDAACSATCDNTDDAQLSDYSFGIPSGATINGIEVVAEMAEGGSADNIPVGFSLSWNDGLSWTSVKTATVDGTTDTDYTLGDSSDTWGRSWIDTEFADGTFRMRLDKNPTVDNLFVDYLRLKVFYTTDGGESSTTTVAYIHPDHLGGTNAITDDAGDVVQTLDYYPYGTKRIESGQDLSQREYIGQYYDEDTALSYLNARYYDGARGQFTSQDPVFWEDPLRQNLQNPQSLNSYSYAENNPIVKSDPTGRCVGPLVAVCIGGGVGAIGGIANQAFNDYLTGEFGERSLREDFKTYGVAATQGAIVGAGTAGAILLAPVGIAGTAIVGGTAGTLTVGTTYGGNYLLNKPTDPTNAIVGGTVSALTAGTLRTLPQVVGRNPNFGTQAFYTGAHTQRQATEEFFSNSVNTFAQTANRFISTQNYSAGTSNGGGGSSSLVQQLQSLVSSLKGLVSSLSSSNNKK